MSNRHNQTRGGGKPERRISVRGMRRKPPDLKKLSQALIALATAQLEAEAQAEHDKSASKKRRGRSDAG